MSQGMRDWFNSQQMGSDVLDMYNKAKQTAGAGVDWMKNAAKGAMDATKTAASTAAEMATPSAGQPLPEMASTPTKNIGETIAQAAKGSNLTEAEVMNPSLRNVNPAINQTVSQVAGETNALGGQAAQNPALRTPNAGVNPNVQPGVMSPEAQAYKASQAAPAQSTVTAAEPAKAGRIDLAKEAMGKQFGTGTQGIRNAIAKTAGAGLSTAGWLAKKVAPVEQLSNVADAVSRASSDGLTYDERKNEGLRGVVTTGGTLAGQILGGVGGAGLGTLALPGAGTAVGALGGQAVGADLGRRGGEWLAEKLLGEKKGKGLDDRARELFDGPQGPHTAGPIEGNPTSQSGSIADTSGYQNAGVRGAAVQPPNENYIQRTGGSKIPVGGDTGYEAARMHAVNSVDQGSGGGLRNVEALAKQGPMGALAALGAFGAGSRAQMNETNVGLKKNAQSLAYAKTAYDIAKDQRDFGQKQKEFAAKQEQEGEKRNDAVLEARARSKTGDPSGYASVTGSYENTVKNQKADMADRYRHTLANMNTTMGKASEGQIQQLHMLDDLRTKTTAARDDWRKKYGSDFFGAKQKDSRDLNDFQPDHYEPSSIPSVAKWIVLKTGEKIPVTKGVGGGFNIFGPNDPMDKQLFEMAEEADKKHKDKQKQPNKAVTVGVRM